MASYSPVFSAAFVIYTEDTPNDSFEVPSGFTAVIRDFDLSGNLADVGAQLYFKNSEAAPACFFHAETSLVVSSGFQWRGRVVVPSGGICGFTLTSFGTSVCAYMGGYLIRNTLT